MLCNDAKPECSDSEQKALWENKPHGTTGLDAGINDFGDQTYPVPLPVEQAFGLQQDVLVGLLLGDAVGKVGGVGVHLRFPALQSQLNRSGLQACT